MTNKQRLELMERFLREHKYADLHTLAEEFSTSLSTVRRALNDLETRGIVRRHHGGASLVEDQGGSGYDFITQDDRQADEKHAIALHIANRIEPGMTVLLDGGTSTYAVARLLISKRVIIVTNSLPIAALFSEIGSSETIVTGGTVYSRLGVLYGPTCELSLGQVHADVAILGAAGITTEGIWNTNSLIVAVQQKMIAAADESIFAIDHTKFGRRALHLTTPFRQGFRVVTDAPPDRGLVQQASDSGTVIETAPPAKVRNDDLDDD